VQAPQDTPDLHRVCQELDLACLPEQAAALERYVALYMAWNQRINLSAVQSEASVWTQHVADCLAMVPLIARLTRSAGEHRDGRAITLLDAGTGAGLPAIILSLWMPALRVLAVDKVAKKLAFVRQAAALLSLRGLHTVHARLEDLRLPLQQSPPLPGGQAQQQRVPAGFLPAQGVDLIVCRAFSSLATLVECSAHLLHREGVWLAMKGRYPREELEALAKGRPEIQARVEMLEVPGLGKERCAVHMACRPLGKPG